MIVLLKAAILGIVEGLTEFIPVSSTGHLIVASQALGWSSPTFEIFIQLGAILALTWAYRERLLRLLTESATPGPARRFLVRVFIAFLPAAVVGLLAHQWIEEHLFRASTVAASLVVGGVLILLLDGPQRRGGLGAAEDVSLGQAIWVGLGQVLSLIPGVSRAGATIVGAMLLGADKRAATEFSFWLAMPTMVGAFAFEAFKSRHELAGSNLLIIAVGFAVSFVCGWFVVKMLLGYVARHGFALFAWWRIVVGGLGLIALLLGL